MFCPYCGKDAGESNFCPECGKDLRNFDYSMITGSPEESKNFGDSVNDKIKKAMTTKDKKDIVLAVIAVFVMVAYTLLPTDIIPDFIPLSGWIDDGVINMGSIIALISRIISYKKRNK